MSDQTQQEIQQFHTRAGLGSTRFLTALRQTGNVTKACEAAQIDRSTAYILRKEAEDFAAAWNDALDEAADRLEAEAWRRAVDGVEEPVYQGGERVGTVRRYSDTLMALLLKAHKPKKYRENLDVTTGGEPIHISVAYVPPRGGE